MMPRVKKGEKAADRGRLNDDFKRFDQKMHLLIRGYWDDGYSHMHNRHYERAMIQKVNNGMKGRERRDFAYLGAAMSCINALGFEFQRSNQGSNSWSPIARHLMEGRTHPEMNLPEWPGDARENTKLIKQVSARFGASDVGICMLDRRWVYSHYYDPDKNRSYPIRFSDEEGYESIARPTVLKDGTQVIPEKMRYVIVFISEMKWEEISVAGQFVHNAETAATYSRIACLILSVAEFIRTLGYQAIPSANCTMQNIPIAIDAGLGESSRMNKLIHPVYGPRVRISKVITDLPLIPDTPIEFGVRQFCEVCKKCAEMCPGRAIPFGPKTYQNCGDYSNSGLLWWQMDHEKCKQVWNRIGNNCGICMHVCPYNKKNHDIYAKLFRASTSRTTMFNKLFVKLDDCLGYGKVNKSDAFWDDLIRSL